MVEATIKVDEVVEVERANRSVSHLDSSVKTDGLPCATNPRPPPFDRMLVAIFSAIPEHGLDEWIKLFLPHDSAARCVVPHVVLDSVHVPMSCNHPGMPNCICKL